MWHVSVAGPAAEQVLYVTARRELAGVGDAALGQWTEPPGETGRAYHLRRRLTEAEAARVGPLEDVRGTPEARRRLMQLPAHVRAQLPTAIVAEELAPR